MCADPSPGRLFGGRYRAGALLAEGGMGAVYLAVDERLERRVVVKVLRPEYLAEPVVLARFEREAMAVSAVHHPAVVQVLDVGREPQPYVVMEYVPGSSLAEIARASGPLPWPRVVGLVEELLDALVAVHAAGIVHRDLKPANVLATATGRAEHVRLIDFGIAQLRSGDTYRRLTQTGVLLGTPLYMAPEQVDGRAADARTDVHAVGVLAWTLLTGRCIHEATDVAQLVLDVLTVVPARLDALRPDVPRAIADTIAVALAKDPERRFPSAATFAEALRAARTDAPTFVAHAAPTPRRPGPLRPALGLLAIVGIAVVAGYALAARERPVGPGVAVVSSSTALPIAAVDAGSDAPAPTSVVATAPQSTAAHDAPEVAAHHGTHVPAVCRQAYRCCVDLGRAGREACAPWLEPPYDERCARVLEHFATEGPASCRGGSSDRREGATRIRRRDPDGTTVYETDHSVGVVVPRR